MEQLTSDGLEEILEGAAILGCGGGGPVMVGRQLIANILTFPEPVRLADPRRDVPGKALMAVSAFVGSQAVATQGPFQFDAATRAFDLLDDLQRKQHGAGLQFVLPVELGAGNSFIPMTVAVRKGLPVVDADGAGRAIPALTMTTYASHGLSTAPLVLANDQNQATLLVDSPALAEPAVRGIVDAPEFGGDSGMALWTMSGSQMRKSALLYTLSQARQLGQTLRQARQQGADPVEAVRAALDGWVLFRGKQTSWQEHTAGGFDLGTLGLSNAAGEQAWIMSQNENLIIWSSSDSRPLAIAPDLICFLAADGTVFTNAELSSVADREIVVLGARAPKALRAPAILQAFGGALRAAGYPGAYVPIERLRGGSKR